MKLHWKPSEFVFLPPAERALMYAFIEERLHQEEEQQKKLKSRSPKGGRKGGRK